MARKQRSQSENLYGFPSPISDQNPLPIKANRAPTTEDVGFSLGQLWVDIPNNEIYALVNVVGGVAQWNSLGNSTGDLDTLTGNSGGAVGADGAGNIDILGSTATGINIVGTPGTNSFSVDGIASSTTQVGTVELATDAETIAGTDPDRAVVPSSLDAKLGAQTTNGIIYGQGGAGTSLGALAEATDGQIPIGNTGSPPTLNTLTGGSGISITNGAGSITISGTSGGFAWTEVTGTTQAMADNNGYIANNAGLVTLTLPAVAAIGDTVMVTGKGAGGWRVAQNAGQQIFFGTASTTIGAGGSLDSTQRRDTVELVCITANTEWNVIDSVGNLTVI